MKNGLLPRATPEPLFPAGLPRLDIFAFESENIVFNARADRNV